MNLLVDDFLYEEEAFANFLPDRSDTFYIAIKTVSLLLRRIIYTAGLSRGYARESHALLPKGAKVPCRQTAYFGGLQWMNMRKKYLMNLMMRG